jgi:hypothetical protein
MAQPLMIGEQTTNYKALYHYTHQPPTEIPAGCYWTEFMTSSPADAKAMTGSTNHLNYRVTVLVNAHSLYNFFLDGGTRYGPIGLGMALVFRNKNLISSAYLKIDRI